MPPPVPPKVKDGRMMAGRPTCSIALIASSRLCTTSLLGQSSPILVMASRNSSRSSALSIASALAPISSTLNFLSRPSRCSAIAVLSAVWPPMVGRTASGFSFSMMRATMSGVIGSI